MGKSLENRLYELRQVRTDPTSEPAIEKLHQALGNKSNHLVAAAARIVDEFEIGEFEDDLIQAFERFMEDPVKTDPTCAAKTAIVKALSRIEFGHEDLFLSGVRHVQLEPVYGGKEDTAVGLRVASALGLVQAGYPEVMVELAHLLADPEPDARVGAVRAIAYAQQQAGVPLLRFKALSGDDEVRVIFECFGGLLKLAGEESLEFVAGFLEDGDPAIRESAIVALGESRLPEVLEVLKTNWEKELDPGLRRATLLAVSMLRSERAIEFLLFLIDDAPVAIANEAIQALEIYRHDEPLWGRVTVLAEARGDVNLRLPDQQSPDL